MNIPPLLKLIEQFERLPGIGRKTAERLAFFVINLSYDEAKDMADSIIDAKENISLCPICGNFTDVSPCVICSDSKRDNSVICVIEQPKDVMFIERTHEFKGLYHVLHGAISPLNNIYADDLKIKELLARLKDGSVTEVILATNASIEGEATAMYLSRLIKPLGIMVTRLAQGIPIGGDLEYADEVTLSIALSSRKEV